MNEFVIIALNNGTCIRALQQTYCHPINGGGIRYLGEDGEFYSPSDIVSISPFDKEKCTIRRDCIYQLKKDKEQLERKIESMLLSFSEQYGVHIDASIKEHESTDVNTNKKSQIFNVTLKISI